MKRQSTIEPLDREWKELILKALEAGMTPDSIRNFFQEHKNKATYEVMGTVQASKYASKKNNFEC